MDVYYIHINSCHLTLFYYSETLSSTVMIISHYIHISIGYMLMNMLIYIIYIHTQWLK